MKIDSYKILFKSLIFTLCLLSGAFGNGAEEGRIYAINQSIVIQNGSSSSNQRTVSPSDNLTFEIVGEGSWFYRLKVYDSNGDEIEGDFISSRGNIDTAFIFNSVINDYSEAVDAIAHAGDPPICEFCEMGFERSNGSINEKCNIPGTDEAWKRRCEQLYNSDIPEGALDYALKAMKVNATSFKTSKCFDSQGLKQSNHPSMMGLTGDELENDLLRNGLANKCQMIINDVDDRSPSAKDDDCRGQMYYIDLCQGDNPVVVKDYFNLGTGTCRNGRNGYRNGNELHTTVKGVFFTHTETFDFRDTTRQQSQYAAVQKQVQDAGGPRQATALHLFGIQNTNNLASRTGKYIHVSPHRSSWGCPSIKPENYYMIEALANGGPGMVVNWSATGMEDIEECNE